MVSTRASQFPDGIPPERDLPLGERPIHEYLRHQARERPTKPAINFHGREITYAELDAATDAFATYLADRGYGADDTVLIHLQNIPQYYIAYFGGLKCGARVSPSQPMSKSHRLQYQLEDSGGAVLVTHDTNADMVAEIRDETDVSDVIYTRYERYLPSNPVPSVHADVADAIDRDREQTGGDVRYLGAVLEETAADPPALDVDMDDVCFLLYSSGTTGLPKGCMHTYRNTILESGTIASIFNFDEFDPHLCFLPVCHAAGLFDVYPQMIYGNTVVLLSRYEPEAALTAIDAYGPEIGLFTTQVVTDIFEHDDTDEYDLSSIAYAPTISFGKPVDSEMAARWAELTGGDLSEYTYGGVEYHGDATFTYGLDHEPEPGFCGRPMYDIDVVIRDFETHEPLEPGEVGEITVDSPALLEGYWNMPEETDRSFHGEYYLSGDMGRLTEEGYLYFLGRQKYMIKYSGFSIAPAEVETILEDHPAITTAGVVGRADDERGEIPVAFVETTDASLTDEDVIEWAKDQMAAYKRPREVVVLDRLPRTDIGKVDREQLLERIES
jgi:long-chain acyl-CoA synthetase